MLPEYQQRCARLHQAGKFVCAHFDGDNRGLLEHYQQTGLDGIPAIYFDEIYPVEQLECCVRQVLDLFAPHLILGISNEISSTGDIERIRLVGRMVDEYNEALDRV